MKRIVIVAGAIWACLTPACAQDKVDQAKVDKVYADMFKGAKGVWAERLKQDETQMVCSKYHNQPPAAEEKKILARETATIKYPADGNLMGDWKAGEKIAQSGFGGRFNDKPATVNGGNCYACHQLSRQELSFGTLGPSLLEYGKIRHYAEADKKAAFAKIYNPQAVFPCSSMPRFGHNKVLSEQQIKDLVALLFDPESPVNK
ncbi:MAG: sulfur oxidation c-type cytochrome SoxX [Hyphomicrobiaceae bacterium]